MVAAIGCSAQVEASTPSSPLYPSPSFTFREKKKLEKEEGWQTVGIEEGGANSIGSGPLSGLCKPDFNKYFESGYFDCLVKKTSQLQRIEM